MCGRASQYASFNQIRVQFDIDTLAAAPNAPARFNAAPTHDLMVVRREPAAGVRQVDLLRWGLVPHWAKDLKIGNAAINARCETVEEKPMFRGAWTKGRRCIIPFDNFFEWKRVGKARLPHAIALADQSLLGIAGLWEAWRSPGGEVVRSFTILTTAANDLLAPLHDRMPVILAPSDYEAWLAGDIAHARDLLRPYPSEAMRFWPVSTVINKVGQGDDPSSVMPINPA